ncbi:MAG: low molecular weight phosphotyrosine protein phosphatase [Gammaproteobacteria bacterium]|uniref:arsenate reductase/protein-tyrosine-phosphatase family protein n=1 Tax=Pseudomaricurvus alcaniphilus TaxID=1166482 RepID=UPI00140B9C89|nr:low molecular weight phosphotyrosine protein phosphatase [Gammaproteobacteria bacterium]NHN36758.1 low molecular weight phosphotyrosine protein phosphatase [Pseudomaricurvus alcaniphilus]
MEKLVILVVCRANICRSPLAEGVLKSIVSERGLTKTIKVDSAGTHAGLISSRPDLRAQRVAEEHGINIRRLKSRRIRAKDFQRSTHILAMDQDNLKNLREDCPSEQQHKLSLLLDYSTTIESSEVPDPYYGSESGFLQTYQMLHTALNEFVDSLIAKQSADGE